MKSYILAFLLLFIVCSCRIYPPRQSKYYKHKLKGTERNYQTTFMNQDSTSLISNKRVLKYNLTNDSLIVFEKSKIYKFYKDSFQIILNKKSSIYNKTYYYDGGIISIKRFDDGVLIYEKRNFNGIFKRNHVNLDVSY